MDSVGGLRLPQELRLLNPKWPLLRQNLLQEADLVTLET